MNILEFFSVLFGTFVSQPMRHVVRLVVGGGCWQLGPRAGKTRQYSTNVGSPKIYYVVVQQARGVLRT